LADGLGGEFGNLPSPAAKVAFPIKFGRCRFGFTFVFTP